MTPKVNLQPEVDLSNLSKEDKLEELEGRVYSALTQTRMDIPLVESTLCNVIDKAVTDGLIKGHPEALDKRITVSYDKADNSLKIDLKLEDLIK